MGRRKKSVFSRIGEIIKTSKKEREFIAKKLAQIRAERRKQKELKAQRERRKKISGFRPSGKTLQKKQRIKRPKGLFKPKREGKGKSL